MTDLIARQLVEDITGLVGLPQPLGKAIKCPKCKGLGTDERGRECAACGGTGTSKRAHVTESVKRLLEVARLSRYAVVIRILPTSFWVSADHTETIRRAVNLIVASLPTDKRDFFQPWYDTEFADMNRWYRKSHGWIAENGKPLTGDEIWHIIDFVQENLTSNKADWRVKVYSEDGPEWRSRGPDAIYSQSESLKSTARRLVESAVLGQRNAMAETRAGTGFATLDDVMSPETRPISITARACPWAGTKTTMYGGIPGGGGFRSITEYLVGTMRIFEAAHCILGSLVRMAGNPVNRGEIAHIKEEMDIIGPEGVEDYGRDIPPYSLDPAMHVIGPYNMDKLQQAVNEINAKAPKLIRKALKGRGNIERNQKTAQPEMYAVAERTYNFIIVLASALLESVERWPDKFESAFNMPEVRSAHKNLERDVEKLYDVGTRTRRESETLHVSRRIVERISRI